MKKLFLSFFLLGSLLLVSCTGELSSKDVAAKFIEAVNANNFEEAQKYAEAGADVQSLAGKNLTVVSVEENGDAAALTVKAEGSEEPVVLNLKKVEGKWVVAIEKVETEAMPEEVPAMEEATATETVEGETASTTATATEAEVK